MTAAEHHPFRFPRSIAFLVALGLCAASPYLANPRRAAAEEEEEMQFRVRAAHPVPGRVLDAKRVVAAGKAVVNFDELARRQAEHPAQGPIRAMAVDELEEALEPDDPLSSAPPALAPRSIKAPTAVQVASPLPTSSFIGLDDIPMVDSLYIVIPPDCGGAVGPTKTMSGLNNNYRIFDKSNGSEVSTVGTATFWAPSGETLLNGLTDPRTLYDPYNNRWITVMQSVGLSGDILVGVSQTSDPSGSWFLYRFQIGAQLDFPTVGFNKNWISIAINRYSNAGMFQRGINLVVDYGQARAGTGTGILFTQAMNTHFCSAPCVTYSATEETLFVLTHLASSGATYSLDTITGTGAAPVYTSGGTLTRPGGGWAQPGGQIMPQSAPNSGASSCGATPCRIEAQDSQIRSAPVYRNGALYYTQTIGLPATGLTHTAAQWTKLNVSGGFLDGGRIEDPTATSTNGGKWYGNVHIGVNAANDFMVGYSQFSSSQHPSAGYSMHLAGDAAGTIRDPHIYKTGEDYYHKDFASGRNRWGDFSQVQVDPSDDQTLWAVQEYAKARVGTNDGTTGANSSRWSTYWAAVSGAVLPLATIAPGPSATEGNSGLKAFNFTVNLSSVSAVPVTVSYQTADGTATVANNDYQAASSSIIIPAGSPSGTISINVVGDTTVEPNETFTVSLTGATNATVGVPSISTGTIQNDDTYTITASAGAGGTIAPSGAVSVAPGGTQAFTITPNACYHIADVLVDGSSVGAVTNFTFPAVSANHTILASFNPDRSVSIGDVVGVEGSGGTTDFDFPVFLSGPCSEEIDVTWKTLDGTATAADGDFVADSTGLAFAPGITSGTITVHVNGDLTPEGTETFQVGLLNPVNVGIADGQGEGTILNDDGASAVEEASVREVSFAVQGSNPAGAGVSFRLRLPAAARAEVSVYDIRGRRVARPLSAELGAGSYTISWNADRHAASGVYFVRFTAADKTFVRRFVLLR